jgi:RNA methyltransferase, TrmH family
VLSRADARLIQGLHRRKVREREGLFLAEGVRVVEDLLASPLSLRNALISSNFEDDPRAAALVADLEARSPVERVSEAELARLSATDTPQGILVVAHIPQRAMPAAIPEQATVLVLDGVQDPGNLGTMLRTAEAFGLAMIAALPGTVDVWNPKVVRSAAGAAFRLPVVYIELDALMRWLRERDFTVMAADMAGEDIGDLVLPPRCALLVGNEGEGLRPETVAIVDRKVSIPMHGRAESLNVAVAAGICMYVMTRRA